VCLFDLVELESDFFFRVQSLAKGKPANVIVTVLYEPLGGVGQEDHECALEEGEDGRQAKEPPPTALLLAHEKVHEEGGEDPNNGKEFISRGQAAAVLRWGDLGEVRNVGNPRKSRANANNESAEIDSLDIVRTSDDQ
jgi:hypothetical protein